MNSVLILVILRPLITRILIEYPLARGCHALCELYLITNYTEYDHGTD